MLGSANPEKLKSEFDQNAIPREVEMYTYDFKVQIIAGIFYWVLLTSILIVMIYLKNNKLITLGDFAFVFGIIFGCFVGISMKLQFSLKFR